MYYNERLKLSAIPLESNKKECLVSPLENWVGISYNVPTSFIDWSIDRSKKDIIQECVNNLTAEHILIISPDIERLGAIKKLIKKKDIALYNYFKLFPGATNTHYGIAQSKVLSDAYSVSRYKIRDHAWILCFPNKRLCQCFIVANIKLLGKAG